ncbi:MAG: hypothetical protein COA42_19230 [Alteromonadaceae bacterium]|nr:MAG: hypothetical protein COA42_19230 [Alteromonadaceae bacterium]
MQKRDIYSKSTIQLLAEFLSSRDLDEISLRHKELLKDGTSSGAIQHEVCEIWRAAIQNYHGKNLGLLAGSNISKNLNGNILITIAANSATIGDALTNACKYHEIYSDAPHPCLENSKTNVSIGLAELPEDISAEIIRHMSECMFSTIIVTLRTLSKQHIVPLSVHFSWPEPEDTQDHINLFGSNITFASDRNVLIFNNEVMGTSIPYADGLLLDALKNHATKQLNDIHSINPWSQKVTGKIQLFGSYKECDIKTISSSLCIGPRSLQEKLKKEGTSYQDIVRGIKIDIAKEYLLDTEISISQIALLMGYSEQSAFNHAFKRWTGHSPNQFRNTLSSLPTE